MFVVVVHSTYQLTLSAFSWLLFVEMGMSFLVSQICLLGYETTHSIMYTLPYSLYQVLPYCFLWLYVMLCYYVFLVCLYAYRPPNLSSHRFIAHHTYLFFAVLSGHSLVFSFTFATLMEGSIWSKGFCQKKNIYTLTYLHMTERARLFA